MNLLEMHPEDLVNLIASANGVDYSGRKMQMASQWVEATIWNYHVLMCALQGYMYLDFNNLDGEPDIVIHADQQDMINKVKLAVEIANMGSKETSQED
jgi:hypothetical protein